MATVFPVKIQRPLAGDQRILIYNEDQSLMQFLPFDADAKKLFGRGELKVYFNARRRGTELELLEKLPEQDW